MPKRNNNNNSLVKNRNVRVVGIIGNMTHMCKTHTKSLNLNYVRLITMIAVTVWMMSIHNRTR